MSELACRACRKPITAAAGCAVCEPFKRNLVVTGDHPVDQVDLGDLSTEALAAARAQLTRLRALKPGDKSFSARDLNELLRTIATLADAARKVRKDAVSALRSMTFEERAELFVEWWAGLPLAHRIFVRERLDGAAEALQ